MKTHNNKEINNLVVGIPKLCISAFMEDKRPLDKSLETNEYHVMSEPKPFCGTNSFIVLSKGTISYEDERSPPHSSKSQRFFFLSHLLRPFPLASSNFFPLQIVRDVWNGAKGEREKNRMGFIENDRKVESAIPWETRKSTRP